MVFSLVDAHEDVFCIVGHKEGRCSRKVANLSEFWAGQKNIVLLDPNMFACQDWRDPKPTAY